ncbi:MAG TPA: IS4 family transposase [Bacteroidales bacterium]|nr:IS4 family transposase [Bacteroidales bacterium]
MNQGKYVFAQINNFVIRYEFDKCVDRYQGNYRIRDFSCWSQFLCMMFGQLTHRESIRDIAICLKAHQNKIYHIGIKQVISHSTITRANESRDWRIYADFGKYLIDLVRPLYTDDKDFSIDLDNTVYALDSTTIDLCLSVFPWAKFRKNKVAVKMHAVIDLRGNIPVFIDITDGKVHDVNTLDLIDFEPDAFYVMDKAYVDFERLYDIEICKAFFTIRGKDNLKFKRINSTKVDKSTGLKCDQIIKLTGVKTSKRYPKKLRRIKYWDAENKLLLVFLTNNFIVDALEICMLYKMRWQIELFFKWIKQHLRIKTLWGYSPNAVKTQIWIAICTYLLIALVKKQLKSDLSLYEITQILGVSVFDKTPLNELLTNFSKNERNKINYNQLNMFDL